MKKETINRKVYMKPTILVIQMKEKRTLLKQTSYHYQGAPDD